MSNSVKHDQTSAPLISVPIIGYHRSPLTQKFGIPRQPNLVAINSVIEFISPYDTLEAFEGIADFSHLWITWYAHQNNNQQTVNNQQSSSTYNHPSTHNEAPFKPKVRPPRLGGNDKRGVFATRSTYRPSKQGLSVVKFLKIERVDNTLRLHIRGADMVDGTPIIDIKPYLPYSDKLEASSSTFAPEKPNNKKVVLSEIANNQFQSLINSGACDSTYNSFKAKDSTLDNSKSSQELDILTKEDKVLIMQIIAQDPRPAYRRSDTDRQYYIRYKNYDIGFRMSATDDNEASQDNGNSQNVLLIEFVIKIS